MSTGFYDRTPAPVAQAVVAKPYPRPEITSRDGVQGPQKDAVDDLVAMARAHGWTAVVTYSRGCLPHGTTGKPSAVKDTLAVRMVRGLERAVAMYVSGSSWSWDTFILWRQDVAASMQVITGIGIFQDLMFGLNENMGRPMATVRKVHFFRVPAMGDAIITVDPEAL
jgi:hypothetical protein